MVQVETDTAAVPKWAKSAKLRTTMMTTMMMVMTTTTTRTRRRSLQRWLVQRTNMHTLITCLDIGLHATASFNLLL